MLRRKSSKKQGLSRQRRTSLIRLHIGRPCWTGPSRKATCQPESIEASKLDLRAVRGDTADLVAGLGSVYAAYDVLRAADSGIIKEGVA
jgi:hypothetical protein